MDKILIAHITIEINYAVKYKKKRFVFIILQTYIESPTY